MEDPRLFQQIDQRCRVLLLLLNDLLGFFFLAKMGGGGPTWPVERPSRFNLHELLTDGGR